MAKKNECKSCQSNFDYRWSDFVFFLITYLITTVVSKLVVGSGEQDSRIEIVCAKDLGILSKSGVSMTD